VERQICEGLNEVSQDQREEKRKCGVYRLLLFFSLSIAGVKSKKNSKTYMGSTKEERERERGRHFLFPESERKAVLLREREREKT
jgi:hypothetical protein